MEGLVGFIIFIGLVGISVYGIRKIIENDKQGRKLTEMLLYTYFELIQLGKYKIAYDEYIGEQMKKQWSFEEYKAILENRTNELGKLKHWENYKVSKQSNLFTRKSVFMCYYRLWYDKVNYQTNVVFEFEADIDKVYIKMIYENRTGSSTDSLERNVF